MSTLALAEVRDPTVVWQSVGPIFVLDLDLCLVSYSDGKLAIEAHAGFAEALVGALGE